MNTILVIYISGTTPVTPGYTQRYAFNADETVKVGDIIKSPNYNNNMQVVEKVDTCYKYFNKTTGELTNKFKNSNSFPIRTLDVREHSGDIVNGTWVKRQD